MTPPPVLALRRADKRFPGVIACDGIDLALRAGEVHALLGENGAGKSTVVGLLTGTQRPDGGAVCLDGAPLARHSPALALARGIGVVTQHSVLVPTMTVAENMLLGGAWWQRPARASAARQFRDACAGFGIAIDPNALAGSLSPGAQLQVEIIRALRRKGRVLILDEPTSPLGPAASAHLLAHLRRLCDSGLAILLITHRLDEALETADRVTVLRRGKVTGSLGPAELAATPRDVLAAQIRAMMFGVLTAVPTALLPSPPSTGGRGLGEGGIPQHGAAARPPHPNPLPPKQGERDVSVLAVQALTVPNTPTGIDFSIAQGEILGVAGIDGNGQTALAETLAGHSQHSAGEVLLDGVPLDGLRVAARHARGVRYLSDDRIGEGTGGALPVALNLLLKRIGAAPYWRFGVPRDAAISEHAARAIADFEIRVPQPWARLATLSGGTMQKVMLARELDGAARLIIYHKPTIGLDARSADAVQQRIRQAAATGCASLLISADLDEILLLSHRIAVLSRGRLVGIVANGPGARAHVAALMTQ